MPPQQRRIDRFFKSGAPSSKEQRGEAVPWSYAERSMNGMDLSQLDGRLETDTAFEKRKDIRKDLINFGNRKNGGRAMSSSNPNSEEPQYNHDTPHRGEQLGAPLAAEIENRRHDLGVFQSEEAG